MQRGRPIEGKWVKDIVKYTGRAKYIMDIVELFKSKYDISKPNYLAIHWNFEKDFEDLCDKKNDAFFCDMKKNSTLAFPALTKYVKSFNQKQKLKAVYFSASEKTLRDILEPLKSTWKSEFDGLINLYTRDDLMPFVNEVDCTGVDPEDSLDSAEMEICYGSAAFLRAQFSIWSRTVDFERRANHMRTLSDKLFTEIMKPD